MEKSVSRDLGILIDDSPAKPENAFYAAHSFEEAENSTMRRDKGKHFLSLPFVPSLRARVAKEGTLDPTRETPV
jgi:hypothetical protein